MTRTLSEMKKAPVEPIEKGLLIQGNTDDNLLMSIDIRKGEGKNPAIRRDRLWENIEVYVDNGRNPAYEFTRETIQDDIEVNDFFEFSLPGVAQDTVYSALVVDSGFHGSANIQINDLDASAIGH